MPATKHKKTKENILVNNKTQREGHKLLKRGMMESGVDYKCAICGLTKWNNCYITLDVDHIDGDWRNCCLDNLRFICPNCHRQTKTFGNKNGTFV